VLAPDGAFYLYCARRCGEGRRRRGAFAAHLLEKRVSRSCWIGVRHAGLGAASYAAEQAQVEEAMRRLVRHSESRVDLK